MTALTATPHRTLAETLAAPFRAAGWFLVMLTEARTRMAEAERLSRMSDEAIAARGTTREAQIQRIFGLSPAR